MGVEIMGFEVVAAHVEAVDKLDKPVNGENVDKPVNGENVDKPVNGENVNKPVNGENVKLEQELMLEKLDKPLNDVNGKLEQEESIKSDSNGVEQVVKGEKNDISSSNFPKDVVEEFPEHKKIHSFYFPRSRTYDDPEITAKIDHADKDVQRKNQERFQVVSSLKVKRVEKAELNAQLTSLRTARKEYNSIFDEKKKEMEPLQQALGKFRNTTSGGLCSSEKELNDLIHSFTYRIQHESIPLTEEKQLLREIKQLEGTRDKVIANASIRSKLQDSFGQKDAIQDKIKNMAIGLDGVRKARRAVSEKIAYLEDKWRTADNEITSLLEELEDVTTKRDKAFAAIQELRMQRDRGNAIFYQSRAVLFKAKEMAANKKVKDLEELSRSEVENFMSLWNGTKAFRDDYEKRILGSLDMRKLSRDGRMRNPDEKALVEREGPTPSEPVTKGSVKPSKENSKASSHQNSLPAQKIQKEVNMRVTDSKFSSEYGDSTDEEIYGFGNLPTDLSSTNTEIDEEKMKEMKREEELAKAKHAMERKKKLAEKAAVKATIRAQKEAEKKLKEREKKAKKKAGFSGPSDLEDVNETSADAGSEIEKVEGAANNEVPTSLIEKFSKEKTIRSRNRSKGVESVARVILKRKRGTNYWLWVAPITTVILLALIIACYIFSLEN